jgi:hypothetical protein
MKLRLSWTLRFLHHLCISVFATAPCFAAVVFPPTVEKSFTPARVEINQPSIMTITLTNPNSSSISGASINDVFPLGLVNAGPFPGTAMTTCSGAYISPGPTALLMTNATIPANGSCTITAPVVSSAAGVYENATGHLFSSGPPSLTIGIASLTVFTPFPALSTSVLLLLGLTLAAIGLSRIS